jgi:hypothetical protein
MRLNIKLFSIRFRSKIRETAISASVTQHYYRPQSFDIARSVRVLETKTSIRMLLTMRLGSTVSPISNSRDRTAAYNLSNATPVFKGSCWEQML